MKKLCTTTIILCSILCFNSCKSSIQSTDEQIAPIFIEWHQLANDNPQGFCLAEITIKNLTDDTLRNNWRIYYNHLSVKPINTDTAQLYIRQIKASYHSLSPTKTFQAIAPHQNKSYTLTYKGSMMRLNSAPQGPFIIIDNNPPVSIDIRVINDSKGENYKRRIATTPYADGEYIYQQNQRFDEKANSYILPILPQPKEVTLYDGKCVISKIPIHVIQDTTVKKEGYEIDILPDKIAIKFSDKNGLFYAQQTLQRLQEADSIYPSCSITDYPDLHHRGFMLDIARNFTKKDDIIKLIDYLSAYKLNILHLHLTDDEGWRVEIPGLEELTEVGSRRGYTIDEHDCLYPMYCGGWDKDNTNSTANGYLTRSDFIEILKYADQHCMTVIPEIDMPGHSRAAIKAMEARYYKYIQTDKQKAEEYLLTDFNDNSVYSSAQHYNDNVLAVTMPSTLHFIEKITDEICKMYEEAGVRLSVFHIGGDEVAKGAWSKLPRVKTEDEFISKLIDIFHNRNIQLAGWEEVTLRRKQPKPQFVNHNILSYCWNSVPEWNGDESAYILANAGYPVILSCVTNLYMDLCYVNHEEERGLHWGGYTDEYTSFDLQPYNLYQSVRRTLNGSKRDIVSYANNPKKTKLIADSAKNIVGIQAHLFTETIRSFTQVQQYIFPKILGMAERAWNTSPDITDYEQTLNTYNQQIYMYELPRLKSWNVRFHLSQPGIHIEGKKLRMNTAVKNANIHYTTDGTIPTTKSPLYKGEIDVPNCKFVRAKCFLFEEESNTTTLIIRE